MKNLKKIADEITLYSAALSFYTIFSLIPIILIILTLFSNYFVDEFSLKLENFIASNLLPTNKELIQKYLNDFLQNSAKMGIMGILYIFITAILFFDNYETIISKICKKPKRNLWEKIKLYWTIITLFPLLFGVAIYFSIKAQLIINKDISTYIASFGILWISFFLSYQLTLYSTRSIHSLISSLIITVIFLLSKNIFVYYVILNETYKTIYGSIAVLIFIFLWIYISWIIYLSGVYLIKFMKSHPNIIKL